MANYYDMACKNVGDNNTFASTKSMSIEECVKFCEEWDKVRREINPNASRCEYEDF